MVVDSLQEQFIYDLVDYGINPTNLTVARNSGKEAQLIFPGILVADDEYETGALILKGERGMSEDQILNTSIENLEFELSNAIRKLISPEKGAVALIIGHGELSEDEGFGVVEALDGQFEVFKVPMDQAKSVKDLNSFSTIFILGPKQTYTERELYLLDQYVLQGGNLVVAAEGVEVDMTQAGGEGTFSFPLENELDRLLFRYGIRINKDLIQDLNFSYIPVMGGNFGNQEQMIPLPWPYFFNAGRMTPHPITKALDQVNFRFASSLDTVKADGVRKTPLIFGSEYELIHLGKRVILKLHEALNTCERCGIAVDTVQLLFVARDYTGISRVARQRCFDAGGDLLRVLVDPSFIADGLLDQTSGKLVL
jgi:gliding-associated putative ABC transporter substrate-binding component GldG